VPFLVGGGTARALLGFAHRPRDVDVEVPEERLPDAARALGTDARWVEGAGRAGWRATAHVRGVEVDLTAGLVVARDGAPPLAADFALEHAWGAWVTVAGRRLRVAPPEEQVATAVAARDWARLARATAGAPPGLRLRAAYLEARLAASESAAS
jgi:hypothetical protein